MGNRFCNNQIELDDQDNVSDVHFKLNNDRGLVSKMEPCKENEENQINGQKQKIKKIDLNAFQVLKNLGKGSFGKVMLVEHRESGKKYAMKQINKAIIKTDRQKRHTLTERVVLEKLNHPNILQLHYAFQNNNKLYLVVDFMHGGELFHHLQKNGRFKEKIAQFYSAQILMGIEHLHDNGIIYRDLKPENCLLDSNGNLKIADFGLSFQYDEDANTIAKSMCGTPEYIAPEVILSKTGHDKTVDWWSFGAIIYEMLTGLPPFYQEDKKKMFQNIISKPIPYPLYLSKVAVSLLKQLLTVNPQQRLGYGEEDGKAIRKHEFFSGINWDKMYNQQLDPPLKINSDDAQKLQYFDSKIIQQEIQQTPEQSLRQEHHAFSNFTYQGKLSHVYKQSTDLNSNNVDPIQEETGDENNISAYITTPNLKYAKQNDKEQNDYSYVMQAYSQQSQITEDELGENSVTKKDTSSFTLKNDSLIKSRTSQ